MRFLLDSNACIEFLRRRGSRMLRRRVLSSAATDLATAAPSAYELLRGSTKRSAPPDEPAKVRELLEYVRVVPLDWHAVERASNIQARLEAGGTRIGEFDALIAATAIVHDLTLVTHNVSEFQRVQGLRMEDWQL